MRSTLRRSMLLAGILLAALPATAGQAGEEQVALYRITAAEANASVVELDRAALADNPGRLLLPLPDGTVYEAVRTRRSAPAPGVDVWRGDVGDGGYLLLTAAGSLVRGTLRTPEGRHFQLDSDAAGRQRLREAASGGAATCGVEGDGGAAPSEPPPPLGVATGQGGVVCFVPSQPVRIDLLALYGASFIGPAEQAVRLEIHHNVAVANEIFANSEVAIVYSLAYLGPLTEEQPPGTTAKEVLTWLRGSPPEVARLRNDYGADMVSLMIPYNSNENCGAAVVPYVDPHGQERMLEVGLRFVDHAFIAYEQSSAGCGDDDYTFAHEHGHNFGMNHEQAAGSGPSPPSAPVAPWAYGHLFAGTEKGATVMGCDKNGTLAGVCNRVPYFSHSNRTLYNAPLGSDTAHNACVANSRAVRYAGFRTPTANPVPEVQITSPAANATVVLDQPFLLRTTIVDDTTGHEVQWSSDLEGPLGTGASVTARLTMPGAHRVTAYVLDAGGKTGQHTILLQAAHAPRVWADRPAHNQTLSGTATVSGWATAQGGVTSLSFRVDNTPVTLTSFNDSVYRQSVCTAHADLADPSCPFVGWQGLLDTTKIANGVHYLRVTATSSLGLATTFSRRFLVSNTATAVFAPVADAWTWQLKPSANYGSSQDLHLRATDSNAARHTYLKFTLTGITRPVLSARLRLRTGTTPWPSSFMYRLATTSWSESTITWNNGPLDALSGFQQPAVPANAWGELDVTPFITGDGTYTLGMVAPDLPGYWFYSRESVYPPSLIVTY